MKKKHYVHQIILSSILIAMLLFLLFDASPKERLIVANESKYADVKKKTAVDFTKERQTFLSELTLINKTSAETEDTNTASHVELIAKELETELPPYLHGQLIGQSKIDPETGKEYFLIPKALTGEIRRNLGQLLVQAQPTLAYREGRLFGVQLNNAAPGGVLSQIGFKAGDIFTNVNGEKINDPITFLNVIQNLDPIDPRVEIQYEREGRMQERSIYIR